MTLEINKDIDGYKESVAIGLTAKQLLFSCASLISGGGVVGMLYQHIGLTASAYIAIPVVAPIALGGFYTYNGMSFYEIIKKKMYFIFKNKTLTYISTENEQVIKKCIQQELLEEKNRGKKRTAI